MRRALRVSMCRQQVPRTFRYEQTSSPRLLMMTWELKPRCLGRGADTAVNSPLAAPLPVAIAVPVDLLSTSSAFSGKPSDSQMLCSLAIAAYLLIDGPSRRSAAEGLPAAAPIE